MPFRSIRQLDGTLWVAGPRELQPEGTLRRGRGLQLPMASRSVRSRAGSFLYALVTAVPLTKFSNVTLARSIDSVLRVETGTPLITGLGPLSNVPAAWAIAPSVADNAATAGDFFYLGDLNKMVKLDGNLVETKWGIVPPLTSPILATPGGVGIVQIDAFVDPPSGWVVVEGFENLDTSTTIQRDGTSMWAHLDANSPGEMHKLGLDLDLAPIWPSPIGFESPDADFIQFALRFNKPRHVEWFQLTFGSDNDFNDSFSFRILIDDRISKRQRRSLKKRGLADIEGVTNNEEEFKATTPGARFTIEALDLLGDSIASSADNTWAILKIPKLAFTENGEPTWNRITAIQLTMRTNRKGGARFYIDDLKLVGGVGMQGTYQYLTTFKNSVTGHRSNATTAVARIENVERHPVRLSGLPHVPTVAFGMDTQVDTIEVWRTLGNGEIFFHLVDIPNADIHPSPLTYVFTDTYADYAGLHGTTPNILGDEVLPTDNAPPLPEYGRPLVHANRMWWVSASRRLYDSPPGRYESVAGFVDVTNDEEPLQIGMRWQDDLFVFSSSAVYQILGDAEPFLVRRVPGVPGARVPIACALPQGILYDTADGPRLLRGSSSQLLAPDGLVPILQQSEATENLAAYAPLQFVPERDRVFLCQATQVLVFDFTTGAWRDFGFASEGGFYDARFSQLFLQHALGTALFFDDTAVVDVGSAAIPFDYLTAPVAVNADRAAGLVRYLAFTINTNGQLLTPSLLVDEVETDLPTFSTTGLQVVEYPINRWGRVVAPRLRGDLTTGRVEIAEVAFDVYLPETHGVVAPTPDVPTPKGENVQAQAPEG